MEQFQEAWSQVEGSVSADQNISALSLCAYLLLAGVLALYVRLLYRKCSSSPSDTESFSRLFPLLAVVTTGVIAVVKSSLALSLGLVGALSIVRFRAAIKDPEELVYLFLCIAIGLSLGAEQPMLAVALAGVSTLFIVGMSFRGRQQRQQRLLLTITGDSKTHFAGGNGNVLTTIEEVAGKHRLQRFDLENGRGQVRVVLQKSRSKKTAEIVARLQERLPGCDISYVDLNSTL